MGAGARYRKLAVCFVLALLLAVAEKAIWRKRSGSQLRLLEKSTGCEHVPLAYNFTVSPTIETSQSDFSTRMEVVEAIVVFTLIRFDLLDLHLASIDHPVKQVFIVHNYATDDIKSSTLSIVGRYSNCANQTKTQTCANPKIAKLSLLASPHNLGFSGSMNLGIKAVMHYDVSYAFFSGDDTRFRPTRLQSAKQVVDTNLDVCMFHFEGYSSFVLTKEGVKRIGPFDENFWPAYAEDCDYWYRAQLASCRVYYRGGYMPGERTSRSVANAFLDHGDNRDVNVHGSTTYRSHPKLERLVQRTLDATRGRFAYLARKWGFNVCDDYHNVLNAWRESDVILDHVALHTQDNKFSFPYNDSDHYHDTRRWLTDDWRIPGAVSSRAVNVEDAPVALVWQESDYIFLDLV